MNSVYAIRYDDGTFYPHSTSLHKAKFYFLITAAEAIISLHKHMECKNLSGNNIVKVDIAINQEWVNV